MSAQQQNGNHGPLHRDVSGARKLYERRRSGLDRKARDLVMKAYRQHGVDVQVTIIYEFDAGTEPAMFRSHLDGRGRWWPTLDALKADCGPRTAAMVGLSKENLDLIGWANYQQQQQQQQQQHGSHAIRPATPKVIEMKPELPEDILASTLPFDSNNTYEDGSVYDSSCNSSEDSQDDYSASEAEVQRSRRPKEYYKVPTHAQQHSTPHRTSPKRSREEDATQMQWNLQTPPSQPVFHPGYGNTYGYNNMPNTVPIATQQHGMYSASPQSAPSSIAMLQQSNANIPVNSSDLYNNFPNDMGMVQSFPDQMSQLSHGSSQLPAVPQTKRTRKNNHASVNRKRVSTRRSNTKSI